MSEPTAPPTPDGVPLLGNGWAFSRNPVAAMERWAEEGDVVELQFPGQSLYMVTGPTLIERILVDDHERFTISPQQQRTFEGVEDHAVTTATGERWKRLRRALHPAFTRERVRQYGDRMAAVTARYVREWDDGQRMDLYREMRRLAVQLLADALLDVDARGDEDVVIAAADALVDRANFRRPGQLLPDWVPTPTERRFEKRVAALDAFVEDVLADRAAGDAGADVCSDLLAAHEEGDLSMAEVRHNLVGLLLAGHESPSAALTHALRLVSDRPAVEESLVAEYESVAGGDGLDAAAVDDLARTRNVVRETLRLYPPTTGVTRQATEPVTLDGYRVPEGAQLLLPQWPVHRDERFWDDPETFDPSRWDRAASRAPEPDEDDSRGTDRPEYAYFPFSGGPRVCVGNDFARQELTLALATIVGHWEVDVTVDGPLTFTPSLSLRPETEIAATVHRRE